MLAIFDQLVQHCKDENINKIVYKSIPYIYHSIPAEEDLYALFRHNALLIGRSVTATIFLQGNSKFDESRQRAIKKAKNNNLVIKRSYDFKKYMQIVEDVLKERHNTNPVHTADEIELLANRFPDNIKLFCSFKDETMLAGVVVYQSKNVAHAQYIANSNEGRELGSLEVVFDYLINVCYRDIRYFDFGISTEQAGRYFNGGLMAHKEGFGARAVMHDLYELIV
jgi:lipid II:glycine glycyltransferase (peptidoglycan interpeptide bridge formation enzyme)